MNNSTVYHALPAASYQQALSQPVQQVQQGLQAAVCGKICMEHLEQNTFDRFQACHRLSGEIKKYIFYRDEETNECFLPRSLIL